MQIRASELFKDWIEWFFLSWILWDVKGSFILLWGSVIWMDCLLPFSMKGQFILRSLKGVNSAHLDLLRLASAAAAWRSWVDLLTGTPNTALWVTSLNMRLWPLLGAIFGDEGGVNEPTLWITRPAVYEEENKRRKILDEKVLDANRENFCLVLEEKQINQTPKHTKNKPDPLEMYNLKKKMYPIYFKFLETTTTTKRQKNCYGKEEGEKVFPVKKQIHLKVNWHKAKPNYIE